MLNELSRKFLENPNDILSYNDNAKKAIEVSQNISQKIIKKLDEILMLGV